MTTGRIYELLSDRQRLILGVLSKPELQIKGISVNRFYDRFLKGEMAKETYINELKELEKMKLIIRNPVKNRIIIKLSPELQETEEKIKRFKEFLDVNIENAFRELKSIKNDSYKIMNFLGQKRWKYYDKISKILGSIIFINSISIKSKKIRSYLYQRYIDLLEEYFLNFNKMIKEIIGREKRNEYIKIAKEVIEREIKI